MIAPRSTADRLRSALCGDAPEQCGVTRMFGELAAISDMTMIVRPGERRAVPGAKGACNTTLCKAIMGLVPAAAGMITFGGQVLNGKSPAEISRMGIGHVPQGRRLWRSLCKDEHLRMAATGGGQWSLERVFCIFARPAEPRSNGGRQVSGGRRQMPAIARALPVYPRLPVMDKPTEGRAPVIVALVRDMLVHPGQEGDIDVPVIAQNIGVASAVADDVAVMVGGRVNGMVPARKLARNRALPQRRPGVGRRVVAKILHCSRPGPCPGDTAWSRGCNEDLPV